MSAKILYNSTNEKPIKRLVRHKQSKEYFRDGQWTKNPQEASSFADVIEAAQVCARYGLDDVELALRIDSESCDVFCTPLR